MVGGILANKAPVLRIINKELPAVDQSESRQFKSASKKEDSSDSDSLADSSSNLMKSSRTVSLAKPSLSNNSICVSQHQSASKPGFAPLRLG